MKLINKLEKSGETSLYSGQAPRNFEIYLRPVPTTGEDGKPLRAAERYYVFRLLFFTHEDRTNYPFIVRNEHVFFKKDFSGNIKEVRKICCPTTSWARNKIQENVDKDYCPICKFSFEQNAEGWKNYKTTGQIDSTSLDAAKESERQWAAYLPVLVISDPLRPNNNNHFRVLRLSGNEGKKAFELITEKIHDAQNRGINVFNGEEGANIGILCEKREVLATKKNGEPRIDKRTGEQVSYVANCVSDVRLLEKHLHSYNIVTEANIEKLHFDETYNVPATKDQLSIFLSECYLDNGIRDSDFGDDEFSDEAPSTPTAQTADDSDDEPSEEDFDEEPTVSEPDVDEKDDVAEEQETVEEEPDDEFENESPRDAIARITKGRTTAPSAAQKTVVKKSAATAATAKKSGGSKITFRNSVKELPNTDKMRDSSLDIDPDDLPF